MLICARDTERAMRDEELAKVVATATEQAE